MKLIESYTVECCKGFESTYGSKPDALDGLLHHIRCHHKAAFEKVDKMARLRASGKNGLGYWDGGEAKNSGWHKAQATFRDAHRRNALEQMVADGELTNV